jgi:starch phosphorylase
LLQGSDVWLNTPRRPLEACGTSGEKATLNGALNCSILDGWWDEMYEPARNGAPSNGWAIPSAESAADDGARDRAEAAALFELLEREIVPLFYDRPDGGLPRRWVFRVKTSLASLGYGVQATRMVKDYTTELYEPAARLSDRLVDGLDPTGHEVAFAGARDLAAWKQRVRAAWGGVKVLEVHGEDGEVTDLGAVRAASARVELGQLAPSDVEVQLLHGQVGLNDELTEPSVVAMVPSATVPGGYDAGFPCDHAGRYGFAVRVVPSHPELRTWADVGLVTWA